MAAAIPYAGLAFSAASTLAEGNAAEANAALQAHRLKEQGKQDKALSQIDARQERKRAEYLASKLIARAGASGTSLSSPDIQSQLAEIDEKGEYNALAALYSGNTSARSRNLQAVESKRQGKSRKRSSVTQVASDVLSFGSNQEWW